MVSIKLNQHVICIWSSHKNISPNAAFTFKKSHPIQILTRFGSGVLGMGAENPPIHGLHFQVSTIMFTSSAFMPVPGEGVFPVFLAGELLKDF